MKNTLILLLVCLLSGCTSHSQNLELYRKGKVYPSVKGDAAAVRYFSKLFANATGEQLPQSATGSPEIELLISSKRLNKGANFSIVESDDRLFITGRDQSALRKGIAEFFTQYAGLASADFHPAQVSILLPKGLEYQEHYDFEYREPYFAQAMDAAFADWNGTHRLEDHWGIWGHNIGKKIKVLWTMLAKVDGAVVEDQLCFSSPELERALSSYISYSTKGNSKISRFMIAPNDNDIACLCDKCIASGNTPGNASPAAFKLLNKLSKNFPKQEFFGIGYMSTQKPPAFRLESNAGVMISTMAFPKGVVIEESGKKAVAENTLSSWKRVAGKMYLWDYGLNFDNFNEFYPTLLIAQKNLEFYKKNGITGVFINGNENGSAAFGELKAYIYARLLCDTGTDVRQHIRNFMVGRYPSGGKYLADYYLSLEEAALASNRPLDIYGGMSQAKRKYLDAKALLDLYPVLLEKYSQPMPDAERLALKQVLLSLTFQRLELMRTNGVQASGYASVDSGGTVILNPEVEGLVQKLDEFAADVNQPYNESGYTISKYIGYWKSELLEKQYSSLLLGKKLKLLSQPDEDYTDVRMLTDGAMGFYDYYNNWMLATAAPLSVEIDTRETKGDKVLEMGFLKDPRHKIYLPESILVTIGGQSKKVPVPNAKDAPGKVTVSVPLELPEGTASITVTTVKQPEFAKRSVACDEIIIK